MIGIYMDWNWFFSSLAQSTAAIVGIFGAFLITKILSNQATFQKNNIRIRELISSADKITSDADDLYFKWYNRNVNRKEEKKIQEIFEKNPEITPKEIYSTLNFSIFEDKNKIIGVIDNTLKLLRKNASQSKQESLHGIFGFDNHIDAYRINPYLTQKMTIDIENERNNIERVLREARHNIRTITDFIGIIKGDPESSRTINYVLLLISILFYFGVIYPLSFMPVPINWQPTISFMAVIDTVMSIKGRLLILVSIIFYTIITLFYLINARLKYSESDVAALKKYCLLASYSDYFAILEANEASRSAEKEDNLSSKLD